ncbi:uncharacterized protein VTP21DRAFT_6951 [Calcarisporiella thermophila]|uniref:uncharacterized protein n=1 Tax=Calcarisporiella thermophila TaxID=911321 RepID=UPI003744AEF9
MSPANYSDSMETFYGHVKTPHDALLLFEACRQGVFRRVQRRLSDKERDAIRSGAVFVWDEKEAGMRRWTDGRNWSPSRVSGSFLSYRELEHRRRDSRITTTSIHSGDDTDVETRRSFIYRPDGLVKQSYSITTADNRRLHLIGYYYKRDLHRFKTPSVDERLKDIVIEKGYYLSETAHPQNAHMRSLGNGAKGAEMNPVDFENGGANTLRKIKRSASLDTEEMGGKKRRCLLHSPHSTQSYSTTSEEEEPTTPTICTYSPVDSNPHTISSPSPSKSPALMTLKNLDETLNLQPTTLPSLPFILPPYRGVKRLSAEDERQLNALYSLLKL